MLRLSLKLVPLFLLLKKARNNICTLHYQPLVAIWKKAKYSFNWNIEVSTKIYQGNIRKLSFIPLESS